MKGLLGPLLVFIGGAMTLALGLALLGLFWPLVVLGASLAVLHSPKALGLDWQHWEWLLVMWVSWKQVHVFKRISSTNQNANKH